MQLETRHCANKGCSQTFKCYPTNKQQYCSLGCQKQNNSEVKDKVCRQNFLQASHRSIEQQKSERVIKDEMRIKSQDIIPTQNIAPKKKSVNDLQLPTLPQNKGPEELKPHVIDTTEIIQPSLSVEKNIEPELIKEKLMKETEPVMQETVISDLVSFEQDDTEETLPEVLQHSSSDSKQVMLSTMNLLDDSMTQLSDLMKKQVNSPYVVISASKELRETMKVKLGIAKHFRDVDRDNKGAR